MGCSSYFARCFEALTAVVAFMQKLREKLGSSGRKEQENNPMTGIRQVKIPIDETLFFASSLLQRTLQKNTDFFWLNK